MQKKFLLETLQDVGLTNNEAKVYLALLELHVGSIVDIARESGLKRTTLYPYIDSLVSQGMIKTKTVGKRVKYYPENPDKLEEFMKKKERKLERRLPELHSMYNLRGNDSMVGFQEGDSGVKKACSWLLKDQKEGEQLLILAKSSRLHDIDKDFFEEFYEQISESGVEANIMMTHGPMAKMLKTYERQLGHELRVLPVAAKVTSDTMVCGDKVVVLIDGPPPTAITYEINYMAENYKNNLLITWRLLVER